MKKIIAVSGTPGTGKTRISKLIANRLSFKYIGVNRLIRENKIAENYDRKRKTYVVDVKKLNKFLINLIKKSKVNLILDSHLSHYLPKKYVTLCIIAKCSLKILKKRLIKRGYNELKINDNMDSEIFNICLNEAVESGHNVLAMDTTHGVSNLNIKLISKLVR